MVTRERCADVDAIKTSTRLRLVVFAHISVKGSSDQSSTSIILWYQLLGRNGEVEVVPSCCERLGEVVKPRNSCQSVRIWVDMGGHEMFGFSMYLSRPGGRLL